MPAAVPPTNTIRSRIDARGTFPVRRSAADREKGARRPAPIDQHPVARIHRNLDRADGESPPKSSKNPAGSTPRASQPPER